MIRYQTGSTGAAGTPPAAPPPAALASTASAALPVPPVSAPTILARDIMTTPVRTVADTLTLREAAEFLARERISGAPVTDADGFLVGVVSEKDLLTHTQGHATLPRLSAGAQTLLYGGAEEAIPTELVHGAYATGLSASVREVMSYPVITADEDATATHLADLMLVHRLNRVPILRGDGTPVGIVTRNDVLRAIVLMAAPPAAETVPPVGEKEA